MLPVSLVTISSREWEWWPFEPKNRHSTLRKQSFRPRGELKKRKSFGKKKTQCKYGPGAGTRKSWGGHLIISAKRVSTAPKK